MSTRAAALSFALTLCLVWPEPAVVAQSAAPPTRRITVSAVDKEGVPVPDLAAADLEVKIAGKVQKVIGIEPASGPLRIAVLVADGATGGFQAGLGQFVQKLYGRAEFQFTSVLVQPEKLGPWSKDRAGIIPALNRLGPRGSQRTGAQVMEAILEASKDVHAEATRPVILVARIGGEGQSDLNPKIVRTELQNSHAQLYVISVAGANRAPSTTAESAASDPASQARAQLADSDASDSASNLALILGDGSRDSGGRHVEVVSTTMIKAFPSVADELLGQYDVTVTTPDNVKPTDRLSVSAKRKGLTVRAPAR